MVILKAPLSKQFLGSMVSFCKKETMQGPPVLLWIPRGKKKETVCTCITSIEHAPLDFAKLAIQIFTHAQTRLGTRLGKIQGRRV